MSLPLAPHGMVYDRSRGRGDELVPAERDEMDALDKEALVDLSCLLTHFGSALIAVAKVHDYARGPLAKKDYMPSLLRHLFGIGRHADHDAAVAWNALARLQKKIEAGRKAEVRNA